MQRIRKTVRCVLRRFEAGREPDQPWREAYRELLAARQRHAGVVPAHAATPRGNAVAAASSQVALAKGA